jgi:hypothetical protein
MGHVQRDQKFLYDWIPDPVAFVIEMHSILEQIGLHFPFGIGQRRIQGHKRPFDEMNGAYK